jgi:hypothetical protein
MDKGTRSSPTMSVSGSARLLDGSMVKRHGLSANRILLQLAGLCCAVCCLALSPRVRAEPRLIDRVIVRFTAPETGGAGSPRFIFERELAFEARLEALADAGFVRSREPSPFRENHLRAALERHVAETILETLEVTPRPTAQEIEARVAAARVALAQRVGGMDRLTLAARAEGLEQNDVFRILQRQARASLYLDRMVAPMLHPSEAELVALHQSGHTPFRGTEYAAVRERLRRWLVSRRLRDAALRYYEGARTRLDLHILE